MLLHNSMQKILSTLNKIIVDIVTQYNEIINVNQKRLILGLKRCFTMSNINNIFEFNEEKTTQIVAYIMQQQGVDMKNYTKILKLLYLIDKKWIQDTSMPITGDSYYSMKNGPVLSKTYDLMKSFFNKSYWGNFIERKNHNSTNDENTIFDLVLKTDPGKGKLNRALLNIIDGIILKYKDCTYSMMITEMHKIAPEWEDPTLKGKKVLPLQRKSLYDSLDKDSDTINKVVSFESSRQRAFSK